jgi:hypothetical protein
MNSSDSKKTNTLALLKPEQSLKAICELANLRDDPRDFLRFTERWPGFAGLWTQFYEPASVEPMDVIQAIFYGVFRRRESVRKIWRGGDNDGITDHLLPPLEDLAPNEVEKYYEREKGGSAIGGRWSDQIVPDWRGDRFEYKPFTDFQQGLYLLVSNSRLAKVCANPDCPAPYFIAKKPTQQYCSDGCAQLIQRDWKRRWWAEHGEQWRKDRKKVAARKTGRKEKGSSLGASRRKTKGGNN